MDKCIFGELGVDALRTLLIQPTHMLEQFLHNEAGEQRFKPEEILQLEPKVRNAAFACLPNLIIFLESGLSPTDMMLLGIEKLKSWLKISDRHLKLVLRMVSWQEILVQDNHKKLIEACYAAFYTGISYPQFNLIDKNIQADCMENLNGLQVIFKCDITWPIFTTMSKTLRKAFLFHPEASKKLLNLVKHHHFPLTALIKDPRLEVYLNHPPESFILPKLAQDLIDKIQHNSKFNLSCS